MSNPNEKTGPGIVINLGSLIERFEIKVAPGCVCICVGQCREKLVSDLQAEVAEALIQSVQSAAGALQPTPGEHSTPHKGSD